MSNLDLVIAMTVNNRPQYLRETLRSWERARGVEHALFVFACEPCCQEALEVCEGFRAARREVFRNPQQQGVLRNPWWALTRAFGYGQDFAVLAEEDMVVATDTIEYLAWARGEYRNEPNVLAVSTHSERPAGGDPRMVRRIPHFSGWVWGTWADRWAKIGPDWDTDYRHRGWDHRLTDHWCKELGMTVATPDVSRSQHIGREGGTHCTPAMFEGLLAPSFQAEVGRSPYWNFPA